MEIRQLRYFIKICELGSMGRAAIELDVVTSALSQQISRLESELSTRLLQRRRVGRQHLLVSAARSCGRRSRRSPSVPTTSRC